MHSLLSVMSDTSYPYSKAKFSTDDGEAISSGTLFDRARWAALLTVTMGALSILFAWLAATNMTPPGAGREFWAVALLCGGVAGYMVVSLVDILMEIRGRLFVDSVQSNRAD